MAKRQFNILFVAHDTSLYGSNQSLFYLICELRKRHGVNPTVLVPRKGAFTQKLEENHIPYMLIRYSTWQAVYKTGFRFWVKSILRRTQNVVAWNLARKKIKGQNFDCVHSNSSVVKIGAECAVYLKVPHVWHIREYGWEDWCMKYMYSDRYVKQKYKEASALIAVSRGIESKYKTAYGLHNITTVYNGIPAGKFIMECGKKNGIIDFCQVGYISETKNQLQSLEACKILKEKYGPDFRMNFIGSGQGKYYQHFLEYIENNGLRQQVRLWGFQENVEKILARMDIGLITSRMEGFGRVTIEFMLSGMPVLGYASGGTLELIKNGETGFLYHTTEELVHYMHYCIHNRNAVREMGKKGCLWAASEFTSARNADLIYDIYQRVLKD